MAEMAGKTVMDVTKMCAVKGQHEAVQFTVLLAMVFSAVVEDVHN